SAPNKTAAQSCHRCKMPLTQEELIRQRQASVLEVVEHLRVSGALADLASRTVQEALRRADREHPPED
ncbi:MAG: hypothetical protein ACFFER_19160, partial [Candidatus Thorarchaeota archaeon]